MQSDILIFKNPAPKCKHISVLLHTPAIKLFLMTNTPLNKLINHFPTKHLCYSQNFATENYRGDWLSSKPKEKTFSVLRPFFEINL